MKTKIIEPIPITPTVTISQVGPIEIPDVFHIQTQTVNGITSNVIPIKLSTGLWTTVPVPAVTPHVGRFVFVVKDRDWVPETPPNEEGLIIPSEAESFAKQFNAVDYFFASGSNRIVQFSFNFYEEALAFLNSDRLKTTSYVANIKETTGTETALDNSLTIPTTGFMKTDFYTVIT